VVAQSIQNGLRFFVSVMLCLNLAGCGSGASTTSTSAPTIAPPASPSALTPSAPTVAPTTVPAALPSATPVPPTLPPTTTPAQAGDLSAAEMRAIAQASFDAYPWRMNQSALLKSSSYTLTTLTEAAGRERVRILQNSPNGNVSVTGDFILITPTLYVKLTNAPPEELRASGLTNGQWGKVPPGNAYTSYMYSALYQANPISFVNIPDTGDQNLKIYRVVGTEQVSGKAATIYEYKTGDPADPASGTTNRISIGIQDKRIYKVVSDDTSQMVSSIVEYVPGLKVEPPIP